MSPAGTPLYRGFDREQLDREYSPSSLVPGRDPAPYLAAYTRRSAAARARLAVCSDLRYARGASRTLDFFPAARGRPPLFVFIHGGYWCELTKDDSSFLAPGIVGAGGAFAAVDYPLAPRASLAEMIGACEDALAWLCVRADELGFDAHRIVLCGHSAGAHLAAMAAIGQQAPPLAAFFAVSGVYDLEPIRLSCINEPLGLDRAEAERCSPIRRVRAGLPPLLAALGEHETGEFQRQSAAMVAAWRRAGNRADLLTVPGRNHFDVIHACTDIATTLGRAVAEAMAGPERQENEDRDD